MNKINQKNTFKSLFFAFSVVLVFLPFTLLFNDVITKWVENFQLYKGLQDFIVPLEAKLVGVILIPFGFEYTAYLDGMKVNGVNIGISWNCLGWQSLALFLITAFFGLRGNFTLNSKTEAFLIGIMGLFFVNLFRLVFATILAVLYRPIFVIVFHDYLAAVVTIIWLFFFWWFAYSFVLETKDVN